MHHLFQERSLPDHHPYSLMKKLHEHDTTGDMQCNRFYDGLQTTDTLKCPLVEVIVVGTAV
eukprot:12905869-Prorocentrum_lima.AAC.1